MRMPALILTVVAACSLTAFATPQDGRGPSGKEPSRKVEVLQKERIVTLKALLTRLEDARATPEEIAEAKLRVLEAERDAAEKRSERIAISEQIVGVLGQYEMAAEK